MSFVHKMMQKVLTGDVLSEGEALRLFNEPLDEICAAADKIRKHFCGNIFDMCTIINAKSGGCSENCKFCSQSAHYNSGIEEYPLLPEAEFIEDAKGNAAKGVFRYSLVTSGKALTDNEIDYICGVVRKIKTTVNIRLCASFGLLGQEQYRKLCDTGVERAHNNLETSKRYFPKMCTTHSFKDKLNSIQAAKNAGLSVCSGGIFGIGETDKDRVSLAFSLLSLGIKSVPMNLLNPREGTPYENATPLTTTEFRRIIAVYRFILPDTFIRLAGGRWLLDDKGRSCFTSGANAAITGNMLTTYGISVQTDMAMINELGFKMAKMAIGNEENE